MLGVVVISMFSDGAIDVIMAFKTTHKNCADFSVPFCMIENKYLSNAIHDDDLVDDVIFRSEGVSGLPMTVVVKAIPSVRLFLCKAKLVFFAGGSAV